MTSPIKSLIRTIPDVPKPGIRFRDVMGPVEDAQGLARATEGLAVRG